MAQAVAIPSTLAGKGGVVVPHKFEMADDDGVSAMIFDCVIKESHSWRASITTNPVETGVALADHGYMEPDELTMEVAVSDTPLLLNGEGKPQAPTSDYAITFTGAERRSVTALEQLKQWTAMFIPFDVVTGLQVYHNMLIVGGSAEQTKDTAGALKATLQLRQVIFASTAKVTYPPRQTGKPKRAAAKVVEKGEQPAPPPAAPQVPASMLVQFGLPGM